MNVSELAKRLNLDEAEYIELLILFVETELPDLGKIQSYLENENATPAIELIHSLKGAAGNLCLMDIYNTSRELEDRMRAGELRGFATYMKTLREQLLEITKLYRGIEHL